MRKISLIIIAVSAFGIFALIQTDALSNPGQAAGMSRAEIAAGLPFRTGRQALHEHPKCGSVKRDMTAYSRAVDLLDPWRASHRRLAAIYHKAWQAKREWYELNCR